MKKTIIAICIIIGLLEIVVIAAYFCVFNGAISSANQDWDTFIQIFNGLVMTVLTAVNIYIFYQLTTAIENKNQERVIKSKLFEAQSIVTQMRVKQYETFRDLINDFKMDLFRGICKKEKISLIMKNFMEVTGSFSFRNGDYKGNSLIKHHFDVVVPPLEKLANDAPVTKEEMETLSNELSLLLYTMELFIITPLINDDDVIAYIRKHPETTDITFVNIDKFYTESEMKMQQQNNQ